MPQTPNRLVALLLPAAGLFLLAPRPAGASPWTQPKGRTAVWINTDLQTADREWLIDGTYQSFPLQGRYFAFDLRAGVRYGITDRLEVGGELAVSHVEYQSDEVWLGPPVTPELSDLGDEAAILDNLISLDRSATGLSDVQIWARVRVTPKELWRFVLTPELHFKIPTGYAAPAGTFKDDDAAQGVADDVTLGDGQLDITPLVHIGLVPHWRWFIRLNAGFRVRFFGPGQQVVGGLKTGVRIGKFLIPYGEAAVQHTINEGEVVGLTFATHVPEKPAREFRAADLEVLEYRLDRSQLVLRGGLIFSLDTWEIDLNYAATVWGRNVAQIHAFTAGVTVKL